MPSETFELKNLPTDSSFQFSIIGSSIRKIVRVFSCKSSIIILKIPEQSQSVVERYYTKHKVALAKPRTIALSKNENVSEINLS